MIESLIEAIAKVKFPTSPMTASMWASNMIGCVLGGYIGDWMSTEEQRLYLQLRIVEVMQESLVEA